jgi:hypothetical protein
LPGGWILTRGIPLLIPEHVRASIQVLMSDADPSMGAVTRDCCRPTGSFPNADHELCVYHMERIVFAEFGVGASITQFDLQKSTMTRGKRGKNKFNWVYRPQPPGFLVFFHECSSNSA